MSKEDKKHRIIEAAYTVFAKNGYTNSSIKDIAYEAEVAPGLVHYYFKNKLDVLLSVQKYVQENYHHRYENSDHNMITLHHTLEEIKTRTETDPDWYRWRYEIYSIGLKNTELQDKVADILEDGRNSLATPLAKHFQQVEGPEVMASILLACFDGLALQKIIEPAFDIDMAYHKLGEMLEVYLKK
ncbi:TetR/AcrR family transcriptional regulator [Ornithinibacillus scapharcae]|uniref:TetR/AcrR family transcriptional regulator n=1 Tax=Ornithinibacillus scapharcae TaxID=1147159 RepID=UPI000225B820|nr:TetR/AcrR family transcriptional regulator [Ornithinibacillus scapharcae]